MPLDKPLGAYDAVRVWEAGLREQWDEPDPFGEDPSKLEALRAFCEYMELDPDALIGFCFLRKRDTGERFVSKKRRGEIEAKLKAYAAEHGLNRMAARRLRSHILSFLLYSGIQM